MTDLTMAPLTINGVLITLILVDVLLGQWSIITSVELGLLIILNAVLLYATYGPWPPDEKEEET